MSMFGDVSDLKNIHAYHHRHCNRPDRPDLRFRPHLPSWIVERLSEEEPALRRDYSRPLHLHDNSNTSERRYALCIVSLLSFQARASFLLSIHFLLSAVCYCREEKTAAFAAQGVSISYLFLTCSLVLANPRSYPLSAFTSTSALFIATSRLLASRTAPNTTIRRTHVRAPLPNREVSLCT
jgi:hypothetical protein